MLMVNFPGFPYQMLTKHRVDYLTPLFTDFFRKRVRGKGDKTKFKI